MTDPAVALQVVTLVAENCCVPPSATVAVAGETVRCGTSVTVAVPFPPGPVAVIVSVPLAVIVGGAVYNPDTVMLPASALHDVTLFAENCCVAPNPTLTVAGETVGGGGVPEPTATVSELLCQAPGLFA